MSGFKMEEKFGDKTITYLVAKNGTHSGAISVQIDDDVVIDGLNFTTAAELTHALYKAQIAVMSRASTSAVMQSTADSPDAESFMKNSVQYLRNISAPILGRL